MILKKIYLELSFKCKIFFKILGKKIARNKNDGNFSFFLSVKEQESLLQKMKDMEDTIEKLKEELEFLQLEVESKDKEISEYVQFILC